MTAVAQRTDDRRFARSLAMSVGLHALVLALVVSAPSRARPAWQPTSPALVDVELAEAPSSAAGGSAIPALPDALPSPVLAPGEENQVPRARALMRRRALIPEMPAPHGEQPAPPLDAPSSAPEPNAEATATVAPSSMDESRSAALAAGVSRGEGGGPHERAPSATEELAAPGAAPAMPTDLCGDPFNGV